MGKQHVDATARSAAPASQVYRLVRDGSTYPVWGSWDAFELEKPGEDGEPEGVGAIRVLRTGRIRSRERIVELVPDRRLSYDLVSGLAMRDYHAHIELTPTATGTTIRWHSSFRAKVPGTGWLYRRTLQRVLTDACAALAAHAQRLTAGDEPSPPST